jgi:hypothetical protein
MGYRLQGQPLKRTTDREMLRTACCRAWYRFRITASRLSDERCADHRRLSANRLHYRSRYVPAGANSAGPADPFVPCSLEEALKARADQQRYLEQLAWRLNDED